MIVGIPNRRELEASHIYQDCEGRVGSIECVLAWGCLSERKFVSRNFEKRHYAQHVLCCAFTMSEG
jgi:hypothetical protein